MVILKMFLPTKCAPHPTYSYIYIYEKTVIKRTWRPVGWLEFLSWWTVEFFLLRYQLWVGTRMRREAFLVLRRSLGPGSLMATSALVLVVFSMSSAAVVVWGTFRKWHFERGGGGRGVTHVGPVSNYSFRVRYGLRMGDLPGCLKNVEFVPGKWVL